MALKIFVDDLEHVPAKFHELYVQQSDGRFELALSDLDDFVHGLKSALLKERENNRQRNAFGVMLDAFATSHDPRETRDAKDTNGTPQVSPKPATDEPLTIVRTIVEPNPVAGEPPIVVGVMNRMPRS